MMAPYFRSRIEIPWKITARLAAVIFAVVTAAARGDDATFRDLPLERTPSPEYLKELISDPLLRQLAEHAQQRFREGGLPGESPADAPPGSRNSPLSEELSREIEERFQTPKAAPAAEPELGRRGDPTPADPPERVTPGPSPNNGIRSRPTLERFPAIPPKLELRPGSERPLQPGENSPRGAGSPPGTGEARRNTAQQPPATPNEPPASIPPQTRTAEPPRSENPLRQFNLPQVNPGETNRSATNGGARQPPQETPRSRQQFNEAINRIVLDAARHVADEEAETGAIGSALSRDSFLTPLVKRARESFARRNEWERSTAAWNKQSRRVQRWSREQRFDWSPSIAGPRAADYSGWSSELKLLAAPVVFGAVVLLLLPLWVRLRPKLAAYLHAAATLASLRTLQINSSADLVSAVDRFLLARFGLSAAWWHCRTVERELLQLRPEMSGEVSDLAATYELSRYGPESAAIGAERLEQSAQTLRRLADPADSEPGLSAAL